jgi:hypothetical protein
MKNKLFLSLSLLTMAFSAQALQFNPNRMIKLVNVAEILTGNKVKTALAITSDRGSFLFPKRISSAARFASNAKVGAVIAAPTMVLGTAYAAGTYALDRVQAQATELKATELNRQAEKLAKAKMIGAQFAEEKANIQAGLSLQTTRMQRVKSALTNAGSVVKTQAMNAGSLVKSNVQAHPRIATGAGLVTLAGLSYAAYNKFGKAVKKSTVNVSTPVVKTEAKKETVTLVATPVKKAKKAKKANKPLKGGYARRK